MEIVKLIMSILILVLMIFFMEGFFNVCRLENKRGIWRAFPKRKPVKNFSEEKRRNFLVSLENGVVTFCEYDFEKKRFEIDEVDAWQEIPVCYSSFKKVCKNFIKRIKERKVNES